MRRSERRGAVIAPLRDARHLPRDGLAFYIRRYAHPHAKETQHLRYRENPIVAKPFLYNCRDRDLQKGGGISRGSIVQGEELT
jgi:hypothetical protein